MSQKNLLYGWVSALCSGERFMTPNKNDLYLLKSKIYLSDVLI